MKRVTVGVLSAFLATAALSYEQPAYAAGASIEAATDEQKQAAGEAYGEGMAAMEGGDHEKALEAFRRSYDTVASPNSHLMVGRMLAELGRYGEAYEELQATLAEAEAAAAKEEKYKQTAEATQKEIDDLTAKVAMVTVNVTGAGPGDKLTVGGREIPKDQWGKPVAVAPGQVAIELQTAQGATASETVAAEAGGTNTVSLAAPAAPKEEEEGASAEVSSSDLDTRTLAYIAGGVGVAGLVTFGVFGAMNNSKFSQLEDECPSKTNCPADLQDTADTGRTYQTVANVGLVVGIVGLGTGAVLYFLSGQEEKEQASSTPQVSVGLRSITVSGAF